MSRAGRKRKHEAKRKPCGRLAQVETRGEPRPEEVIRLRRSAARQQPHRLIVGDDAVHFPECETPIGCLFVIGAILPAEYAAANRLARVILRFRAVLDSPIGLRRPGATPAAEPISDAQERKDAYVKAKKAVQCAARETSWNLVVAMSADGQPCPAKGFKMLMTTLRALTEHFRALDKENSANLSVVHTILEEVT